jgi:hypothetical protein
MGIIDIRRQKDWLSECGGVALPHSRCSGTGHVGEAVVSEQNMVISI